MNNNIKDFPATSICCTPTLRTPYDKMYTFGVDRRVQNWNGCGTKFIQELPSVCMPDIPKESCQCYKSYYDCSN